MFDIGALELLVLVIVAIIVIGPKDMPMALRAAGKWVGKIRRASAQFRSGFDAIVREAEMEDMEKKWQEQNAKIMAETPAAEMVPLPEMQEDTAQDAPSADGEVDTPTGQSQDGNAPADSIADQPSLPLDTPDKGST